MIKTAQLVQFARFLDDKDINGNDFYAAARDAGFEPGDLGKSESFSINGEKAHVWRVATEAGKTDLVEYRKRVYLRGYMSRGTIDVFAKVDRAALK